MARNILYVYERIYKEENAMQREFSKQTSRADQRRIRKIVNDCIYQISQECSVIVNYPRMHIKGSKVVLGEPLIMLTDCRLISIKELEDIELGRRK